MCVVVIYVWHCACYREKVHLKITYEHYVTIDHSLFEPDLNFWENTIILVYVVRREIPQYCNYVKNI